MRKNAKSYFLFDNCRSSGGRTKTGLSTLDGTQKSKSSQLGRVEGGANQNTLRMMTAEIEKPREEGCMSATRRKIKIKRFRGGRGQIYLLYESEWRGGKSRGEGGGRTTDKGGGEINGRTAQFAGMGAGAGTGMGAAGSASVIEGRGGCWGPCAGETARLRWAKAGVTAPLRGGNATSKQNTNFLVRLRCDQSA